METLNPFFEWLLKTSFQASLLISLILLLQIFLRSRLPVRWRYSLWLVLLIRLALPWAPQSSVSLFNLLPRDVGSLVAPFSAEPSANVDADRDIGLVSTVPAIRTSKRPSVYPPSAM